MKDFIEEVIILIQFMTRLPIPFIKVGYSERKLGKSLKYFPLVGIIIGGILYGLVTLFGIFFTNPFIIGFLIVVSELMIVGIIHLDGLADTFDGIFSFVEREKVIEIMKDSSIGTGGGVMLILYFIGKILLIGEISVIGIEYILIYPVISRVSTVINAGLGEYAKKEGMSSGIINENGIREVIFSLLLGGIYTVIIKGFKGIIVFLVAIIFIIVFMNRIKKRIGGITGDTMGASLELTSLVVLAAGAVIR